MRFCLDDGTLLIDKPPETSAPATLVLPLGQQNEPTIKAFQPPPSPRPALEKTVAAPARRQRNLLVWIIVVVLLVPLVAGAGLGGWVIFHKTPMVWRLVMEVDPNTPDRSAVVTQTVKVIENRLDALGVGNYEVKPDGNSATGRIIINLPNVKDPERLKRIITTLGKLELVDRKSVV